MATKAANTVTTGSYGRLLGDGGFQSFLWTQFLGAFNDNVYKMIVSILAVRIAADQALGSRYLALAGAVFVIPFLLFAGYAGQIADRFSKTRVLQWTKSFEILVMITGIGALLSHRIDLLLVVLFMLALQANFFSPAKYGVLPEMLPESQLARANGLLELSTFVAIVLGTSFGTWLFERWSGHPLNIGLLLLAIAVVASVISLRITYTAPSGSRAPFQWNPFGEIWTGTKGLWRRRSMWLTVVGISWFWFIGGLFQMSTLLIGKETLHVSETSVGLLVTSLAVGIGIGSIVAGRLSGDHVELGIVPLASALMGAFSIALGLTYSYAWAMVWMSAIGFSGGLFIVPLNAFLQDKAGTEEKGRVLATNNFFNMVGVICASGLLWLLHDLLHFSANQVILTLGAVTVLATVYAVYLLPDVFLRFLLCGVTHLMFRVRIVNPERLPPEGGALLVANHVSFADAMLLGCCTHRFIRFLMWARYYEMKPWKPMFRLLRAIPLRTESPRECVRALRDARKELEAGELVCIFPEGALTRTGHVNPFQHGFERIVDGANAPIIPIYLDGLWGHPLSLKNGTPGKWPLSFRRDVTVYIGESVPAATPAAELRQRVLDLSSRAAQLRKNGHATLAHRFIESAKRNWSASAIADSTGKQMTFGETLTAALLFRDWLDHNAPNQPYVGVLLPSSVAGAIANLGITLAGRTAVNLNFTTGEEGMQAAIAKCGLKTIFTSPRFLEKAKIAQTPGMVMVEDVVGSFTKSAKLKAAAAARLSSVKGLARGIRPDDVAAIIFSSGSTGDPKGVQLTHWNLVSNTDAVAAVYRVDHTDSMLGVLPFFHSFGYTYTLWFPLLHDFGCVYHPNPMDGKTIGELAGKYHSTFLLSTPTFCLNYVRHCTKDQFAGLRNVLVGAEKLRPSVADAFREKFGVVPVEGYGCTEMAPVVSVNSASVEQSDPPQIGNKLGSVGRPLPGVSVRLVNPDTFEPVPHGEQGLLLVDGPSRMAGYLNDEARTRSVIQDGYYNTGDLAKLDDDGFLYIVDRLARLSKIGGEMVPHLKVEEALSDLLKSERCVVVGVPDDQRGERLAVLYTDQHLTNVQLYDHLSSNGLPPLWIPKRENFYRVDAIPTLGTGKTDLRKSRAIAMEFMTAKGSPLATSSGQ